jgi:hypothetical protein
MPKDGSILWDWEPYADLTARTAPTGKVTVRITTPPSKRPLKRVLLPGPAWPTKANR